MTRWGRALAALASVAVGVVAACSGGDSTAPNCDAIAAALVSRIDVKPPSATVDLGDSLQLQAVAYSCAGVLADVKTFTWRSADEATVAVGATGLVKPVAPGGPVAVIATAQGKDGSAQITSQPVPVAKVTVEPATATVGVGRTSTLTARAFDAQNREITGRPVTWSSANPNVVTVNQSGAVTGVAAGGPVAVTATIQGKSGASQITVTTIPVNTVTVAPATATIAAGTTQQFTATLKDELGNTLAGRAINWTSSDPTIASIGGASGLATGLKPGTVTITATSEGKSGTAQLTVQLGAAAKLAFLQQPSTVQAGSVMAPVTVEIEDAAGNRVTSSSAQVTLTLNNAGGAVLGGGTATAVNGVATFNNLTVSLAGNYTLTAASAGLTAATSSAFTVTPRPATKLAFVQQPSNVVAGAAITPAVTVELQDAVGARVTTSGVSIALAIGNNPGSSTLGGTLTQTTVNGVATFSNLTLNKSGTGYTLVASASGLTSATSNGFNVTAGAATRLALVTQPCTTACTAGNALSPAPQFAVEDANGNRVTTSTVLVALTLSGGPGNAALGGVTSVNAVAGLATFSNVSVNRSGNGYILTAASTGLTSASTTGFNVAAGTGSVLSITTTVPSSVTSGTTLPSVSVQLLDANSNPVSLAGVSVSLSPSPSGTLGGTTTQLTNASGVATFTNIVVNAAAGAGYTLVASATGYTSGSSNAFTVVAPIYTLTVTKAGAGTGTVTSSPTGINCGATCSASYAGGTQVTLTAVAGTNSAFTGWSGGGCTGTGTCVVTLNAATTVSATFATTSTLTVSTAGAGTGGVTSSPAGISCGTAGVDCTQAYVTGTSVTLTASPASGSTFTGWSGGGCAGTSTCVLAVSSTTNVTATFALQTFTITTTSSPNGTITSSPTGINCGAICAFAFTSGTAVVLTASPNSGFAVGTWTGCDSFTGSTCNVTANAPKAVSVSYISLPTITTTSLTDGILNSPYGPTTLPVAGGTSPYTWTVSAGALPSGMSLSPGGVLGGTPTQSGLFNFTAQVTDANTRTDTQAYTLNIAAGAVVGATQLGFLVQPTNVSANTAISPSVQVEVQDPSGARVTTSNASVILVFGVNAGGGSLSGNTAQAQSGVATFSNLRVSAPGNGYTLLATSAGLSPATSITFRVR